MDELRSLAESAGYTVVGSLEQVREPDPTYQIGKGKVEELAKLVKEVGAERVIFDNDLKPIQSYNLVRALGVEAIDRFQLILEIFARRASTKESQLQIKLARLRWQLPRARESVRLARTGERPGFMGLGRYEVDVYYEAIRRQIAQIRRELKKIRSKRGLHRTRRLELGFSLVSLAGYTNAGKSTLFNALTREAVPVNVGLFTTLSTTTRSVSLDGKRVLLTDTVGFIGRLPLPLVQAFHSTLEETALSNAIILVLDVHEPLLEVQRKLSICLETLREIGAMGIPTVTALNKVDLLSRVELEERLSRLKDAAPNPAAISALTGENLDELKRVISNQLEDYVEASFILPLGDGAMTLLSELHSRAGVLEIKYEDEAVRVRVLALPWFMDRIRHRIEELGGRLLEIQQASAE